MQTFLPYPDFESSADCLDYRRLGKQRVECKQILNALDGKSKGWLNHPATQMWKGYETALALYGVVICTEWRRRGYNDTLLDFFTERCYRDKMAAELPPWMGDNEFHASHRSNLLRKDPEHYGNNGWSEPHDLPYVWPTK